MRACSRTRPTSQVWLLAAVAIGVFCFVVAVGSIANALAVVSDAGVGAVPAETAVVSVGAGETLWDLAEAAAPDANPAAVVTRIRELNDLAGGTVRVGTPLVVPAGS
ncbi:LysM peptidoglycan-binding domain-containing protein [Prauserella halophila]|uniref:LysM peptidoglycan-binding domain-containing protein n=1 Tax=Prauserella halophila TaxID=185641 RepID=UPI0020A39266|nr:LysM peptidoglycan-binding domain-containing protein [Prauserella halophila]